ncbi:sugar kinase [Halobacteriales archaeon QS_1_68_20]|nr:MAG: sugar kinase [Halobacteriales archaeon QS_1_68_20]
MDDVARAFVPGHVTGFFTVERDEDPTRTGSTGAGVTLTDGVTVEVRPAAETTIRLNGEDVEMGAVERVLDALSVRATVEGETPLPLGAGFGVSGAMALGTALAANELFETALSENELVTVAHGAEVQAGTGLGDVVAQARGGVPIRLEPGGPHHGKLDAVPARGRIEYVSFGGLDTGEVIEGDVEHLDRPGEEALSEVVRKPTVEQVLYASRRFAREVGLLTEDVRAAIRDVSDDGGEASMAMLGDTVFALGTGLSDAGYDPEVTGIHPGGATLR